MWAWLFGGGGGGFGGPGGWGLGGGRDSGKRDGPPPPTSQPKDTKGPKEGEKAKPGPSIAVEVFNDPAVGAASARARRWYRIQGEGKDRLLTLEELKKEMEARRHADPPLVEVKIVLETSEHASVGSARVRDLIAAVKELGLKPTGTIE
jgi:hypothetical protein